jgi:UDPglucose 6-dehydrogenase
VRITVIGTGYLGVTHAACMASLGYEVMGLDIDVEKVAALTAGDVPFYEPGLQELMREQIAAGRLSFTSDYAELAEWAGDGAMHFVSVGTPQKKGEYAADMTYVDAAFESLARAIAHQGRSLLVGKSTVPVGTAGRLADRIAELAPNAELAWNPEFLREGWAVKDTLHPDRLVVGVRSAEAEADLRRVYARLLEEDVPLVVTDFPTAELVKVSANSFLAVKISFINAMAEVCEAAGADVMQLSEALSYDPRIGGRYLVPGLGFGGGCLPKDIRAFMARAGELGVDQALAFLKEVDAINMRRRARTVDLAREQCDGSLLGKRVAVWGAAFKPDSDDIRDSPALDVAAAIHDLGADVIIFDPHAMTNGQRARPDLHFGPTAEATLRGADVVLLLTEWAEFRALDPEWVATLVREANVIDARMALDADAWRAAGWAYRALGRP